MESGGCLAEFLVDCRLEGLGAAVAKRRFTDEELKNIIDTLFKHFNKPWILECEFKPYLQAKGYTDEEIEAIWNEAFNKGLILVSSTPIGRRYELTIVKPEEEEELIEEQ